MVRLLAVKVGFLLNESFSASSESSAPNPPQNKVKETGHHIRFTYPIRY